jgi:hypothetical protein
MRGQSVRMRKGYDPAYIERTVEGERVKELVFEDGKILKKECQRADGQGFRKFVVASRLFASVLCEC